MNGIEAMKAMLEGKTVRSITTSRMYKIDKSTFTDVPTVLYKCDGEWGGSGMGISEWFDMQFEIVPEYDLTFFEAIDAIRDGKKVKSTCFDNFTYYLDNDGKLVYSDRYYDGMDATFGDNEIRAMWKVVE